MQNPRSHPKPIKSESLEVKGGVGSKYLGVPQALLRFLRMLKLESCCLEAWFPRQSPSCPSKGLWASLTEDAHPLLATQVMGMSLC